MSSHAPHPTLTSGAPGRLTAPSAPDPAVTALEADAKLDDWEPPERPPAQLPADFEDQVDHEDFSEFVESGESDLQDFEEAEDLFVVMGEEETDDEGRLITQRLPKQRLLEPEDSDEYDLD